MKKIGILLTSLAVIGLTSCKQTKSDAGSECKHTHETAVETQQPKKEKKVVVARIQIKEGQEKTFIDVAARLVEATRKEEGNLFYSLYQSPLNPVEFIFYEEYKDDDAFQTHATSAHFAAFAEGIKNLTAGDLIVGEY